MKEVLQKCNYDKASISSDERTVSLS